MKFEIKKATKKSARGRVALVGVSGAGKTWDALTMARVLAGPSGRIVVIDTERGSASKYAGESELGVDFDVLELESFSPDTYAAAIRACEDAGASVVVVDSLSHAWMGKDGALEQVDKVAAQSKSRNSFDAWRTVTPMHNHLVEAMLRCKAHLIVTMRAKSEYVIEQNDRGKSAPRKVGLAPIQRDGLEYEFDVVAEVDLLTHQVLVSKSRCSAIADAVVPKGQVVQLAETYRAWLSGVEEDAPRRTADPPPAANQRAREPGEDDDAPPPPAAAPAPAVNLDAFYAALGEVEMPGEVVTVWMKHKAAVAAASEQAASEAKGALVKAVARTGGMKHDEARAWLKKTLDEETRRAAASQGGTHAAA